eukprot:10718346-Alexandrium_andersonii.AAC.1
MCIRDRAVRTPKLSSRSRPFLGGLAGACGNSSRAGRIEDLARRCVAARSFSRLVSERPGNRGPGSEA